MTLSGAIEGRIRDWLRSSSESYAGEVGSSAWVAGLAGYIVRGPGGIQDGIAALHYPEDLGDGSPDGVVLCHEDAMSWPCPTLAWAHVEELSADELRARILVGTDDELAQQARERGVPNA